MIFIIIVIFIIIIVFPLRVFHTCLSWWFYTGVWVTASLFKSHGLFSVDLNNTVVWMVSTCPLISKSSSPFTNPFGILPRTLITIGITTTFMFHRFLSYYYNDHFTPWEFFPSALADGLLSDSKSQVSRTLLSILADLNNAVVSMVSAHPIISKSSSLCTNLLMIIPRAPITIGITITFMFHSFFNSLVRLRYLSFFSLSLNFTQWFAGIQSPQFFKFSLL